MYVILISKCIRQAKIKKLINKKVFINHMMEKTTLFISVTSDFGVQSQGVGIMEAVAFQIAPNAKYINLMHGLPTFNLCSAARTLETVLYLPIGNHVCVCDPGVGSSRKPIILKVARGDFLIGPDNGVLLPASRVLGGAIKCNIIENPRYMLHPVSPLFHGRDIFIPAAAHLLNGIEPNDFGGEYDIAKLTPPPYEEAHKQEGILMANVIHINHYGSIILNILHQAWDNLNFGIGTTINLETKKRKIITVFYGKTYSDVTNGRDVIMKDDYGRVEVATNLGDFHKKHMVELEDTIKIFLL